MSNPTREQVRQALVDAWHETGRVEVLTPERMTDAVMGLLAERDAVLDRQADEWLDAEGRLREQLAALRERLRVAEAPQPKVLWRGPVGQIAASLLGKKPSARGWDPDMQVRIIEDTETDHG